MNTTKPSIPYKEFLGIPMDFSVIFPLVIAIGTSSNIDVSQGIEWNIVIKVISIGLIMGLYATVGIHISINKEFREYLDHYYTNLLKTGLKYFLITSGFTSVFVLFKLVF